MSERTTSLYKDITTDLNQAYREVVSLYQIGDTRVGYLRVLELAISQGCPDRQLWNFPEYKQLPELPENPRTKISSGHFLNCLLVYEQIMRSAGLLDKEPISEEKTTELPILKMVTE